ncbi:nucleotidyl transferase AbiEii/AbiGii toxin family protein [Yimella sp. cx-573]|nr:nucleotidyl transferase AbiEii/AbiGii toxin family protein [Yimella sp. cx-573]
MRYPDERAFDAALKQRLAVEAKRTGAAVTTLRRQFAMECYLGRLFADPDSSWVLKGGTGLLLRVAGARFSRDLDLADTNQGHEHAESIRQLIAAGGRSQRDPFVFEVQEKAQLTGAAQGAQLTVVASLAGRPFDTFPIDMATHLDVVGRVEVLRPEPVVHIDDVTALPTMRLYPLEDQIADKFAAMYEHHLSGPSSRYRDLADLALISLDPNLSIDMGTVAEAIATQERVRGITVPYPVTPPGPAWATQWPKAARQARLPERLHDLDRALDAVGEFYRTALDSPAQPGSGPPTAVSVEGLQRVKEALAQLRRNRDPKPSHHSYRHDDRGRGLPPPEGPRLH